MTIRVLSMMLAKAMHELSKHDPQAVRKLVAEGEAMQQRIAPVTKIRVPSCQRR